MSLYNLQTIRTEALGDGAVLATLNRPEKLNAIDAQMWDDLVELANKVTNDESARVLLITGNRRGFCAGADLQSIYDLPDATVQEFMRIQEHGAQAIATIKNLPKPVIALVNGPATGGGLALALACDIRVASTAARFNVAFVRLGLSGCDVGVSWLLPRIVGFGHASELMLTGRLIDAEDAHRIGLVNWIVEPAELFETGSALVRELVANSPFGLRLTKQVLQLNVDAPSLESAIALENRNQALASRTDDMREAASAFEAKRPPSFRNR